MLVNQLEIHEVMRWQSFNPEITQGVPFSGLAGAGGFTNGERAVACDPMLTTVEQRGVAVGEEAANILISQVEGSLPRNEVAMRVVRTRLVVRGTTR